MAATEASGSDAGDHRSVAELASLVDAELAHVRQDPFDPPAMDGEPPAPPTENPGEIAWYEADLKNLRGAVAKVRDAEAGEAGAE